MDIKLNYMQALLRAQSRISMLELGLRKGDASVEELSELVYIANSLAEAAHDVATGLCIETYVKTHHTGKENNHGRY